MGTVADLAACCGEAMSGIVVDMAPSSETEP